MRTSGGEDKELFISPEPRCPASATLRLIHHLHPISIPHHHRLLFPAPLGASSPLPPWTLNQESRPVEQGRTNTSLTTDFSVRMFRSPVWTYSHRRAVPSDGHSRTASIYGYCGALVDGWMDECRARQIAARPSISGWLLSISSGRAWP